MAQKTTDDDTATADFIQRVRLVGRAHGLVKKFPTFSKKHHTLPAQVTPAATAFLGKLCAAELADDCEKFFQETRVTLGYKRKDLALEIATPSALLVTRDFTLEWLYALDENDPAEYTLTRSLHRVRNADILDTDAFDGLFTGAFDEIIFTLTKSVSIDAVIDAVESLDDDTALTVEYPSTCADCTLRVEGVPAEVIFTGGEIAMRFTTSGSPRELLRAFARVRHAFSLTKSATLFGLL